jgi:hypothetical protein
MVDVHFKDATGKILAPGYRDDTVVLAEQDAIIGTDSMPYPPAMSGPALINYRTADLANKRVAGAGYFSSVKNGDPGTPILTGYKGDPIKVHFIGAPGSEQDKVAYLGGLAWPTDPYIPNSEHRDAKALAPWEKVDANILGGVGAGTLIGDMAYGTSRLAYVDGGMWGLIRSAVAANTSNCRAFSNGQLAPKVLDGRTCQ